jgi:hypothetical protein
MCFERISQCGKALAGVLFCAALTQHATAQQSVVPFDVCASSATWIRPSADVQSKIWNDHRYRDLGPNAFEWTHTFIPAEPDSASIQYSIMNLSGVWTDVRTNQCPWRGERGQWTEIWSLNYHITGISLSGLVYTIDVVPLSRGYEIIQFLRPQTLGGEARTRLRFVTQEGRVLTEWRETSPSAFDPK